uniref:Calcium-activated potassium channel subunit beta n=1 Tax=Equus caballus TaxID=9796 RepID=A0A9L0TJ09_HORSE
MAKLRVAYEYTEAEDKSLRLGLFLIVSGVVSLFIFGFCWLGPALQGLRATAANCTVLSVQQLREEFECTFTCGSACSGTAHYPCVQVFVRGPEASSRALLHPDERQLLANPKCSYIPPCKRENQKNLESVMNWQQYWEEEIGSQPFTCYFNQFQSFSRCPPAAADSQSWTAFEMERTQAFIAQRVCGCARGWLCFRVNAAAVKSPHSFPSCSTSGQADYKPRGPPPRPG